MAWLRDNGRYLAPSGAGDLLYAFATVVRNWFASHYVVGTSILLALSVWQTARWALLWLAAHLANGTSCALSAGAQKWPSTGCIGVQAQALLETYLFDRDRQGWWWSSSWALPVLLAVLVMLPVGIAYWLTYGQVQASSQPERWLAQLWDKTKFAATRCAAYSWQPILSTLLIALVLGLSAWLAWEYPPTEVKRWGLIAFLAAACVQVVLAVAVYGLATAMTYWKLPQASGPEAITQQRVRLTRWLTTSLKWVVAWGAFATIDTLAQSLARRDWNLTDATFTVGGLAGLVALVRMAAASFKDKTPGQHAWWHKLPVGWAAGAVGIALWLLVMALWGTLLMRVVWAHGEPQAADFVGAASALANLAYACATLVVSLVLVVVVACYPSFLNLSTLQSFYSARIIRAYLGATNHKRFKKVEKDEDVNAIARDVAEPIEGDGLSMQQVYANPLAPIHFINVCVNQTLSPGEQLLQRDRKGRPLVFSPEGYYFDHDAHTFAHQESGGVGATLSYGEWLGVSGAAFSTGVGHGTSLGLSLIMGFANVRLGRWWPGLADNAQARKHMKCSWVRRCFPTQSYMLDELCGRFHGDTQPLQYLSDGGHFENTAVYELLRTDRKRDIRLIVVTDCGADPQYQFTDLANLIRMVRIDHGLEITVNEQAAKDRTLGTVFGRPCDVGSTAKGRCAIMLDVCGTPRSAHHGVPDRALFARIVLIKPVMLDGLADVTYYKATHPGFPQESTTNQFFGEAQWESYRQLGLHITRRVFSGEGTPDPEAYRRALWRQALQPWA